MSDSLRLSLLGGLHIERGGVAVGTFVSSKAPALLAYLAATGRPHLRPVLAGLLWGEWPEAKALASLRKVLSNLRQAVGPWLTISGQSVAFDGRQPYWLDLQAFQQHLAASEAPPGATGHESTDTAHLQSAMALYQGDFLEGFYVRTAPEFEEWVATQRECYRQMAIRAAEKLTSLKLRAGELGPALECSDALLALAPWSEEAHRQRMWLLARSGQRSAALAQYDACRRTLERELGVQPSSDTERLYGRIVAAGTPRPNNLPAQATPFVGRETERTKLLSMLMEGSRLVTLAGPGGAGKTRLALEVARQAAVEGTGTYLDGVYLVRLVGLETADALVQAIAQAIGLPFSGRQEPRHQLAKSLRRKAMLLVLDNCEEVLDGVGVVAELLREAPGVTVLATSRVRLGLLGEQVIPLSGLRVPEEQVMRGRDAERYDAVRLFDLAARRTWPQFELKTQAGAVAQICRLVEGMPLAILLVAGWAGVLSPPEMVKEVQGGLGILAGGSVDLPERQQSQQAVFEASWGLLDERERVVFEVLSTFRGGFSREAASVVAGATVGEIRSLIDKSFVYCLSEGRYAIHELLRKYAAERLDGKPEAAEEAYNRHCAYYCRRLEEWDADLRGPRQNLALGEMEAELHNAVAAWDWAVEKGQVERLDHAAGGLALFYYWRVRLQEGQVTYRRAVESLTARPSRSQLPVVAKLLIWESVFAWELGQSEMCRSLLMQASTLLEEAMAAGEDVRNEHARLLRRLASLDQNADHDRAEMLYEQSLQLCRETGNLPGVASSLQGLGWIAWSSGAYGRARQLREESLAIRRRIGDPRAIASCLSALANGAVYEGRFEEAERCAQECIAIRQANGDRHNLAWSLVDSAALLLWSGRFGEASSLYRQAVAIWTDLGAHTAIFDVTIAAAELLQGSYEQALEWAQEGLAHSSESGNLRASGLGRLVLGGIALVRESFQEASSLLQESASMLSNLDHRAELGWALGTQAYAERRMGLAAQARYHVQSALQTACDSGDHLTVLFAIPAMALLLLDDGEVERAVELYALASKEPFVGNSRWFDAVAGRTITSAAEGLPPAIALAAQERGRARDLRATVADLLGAPGKQRTFATRVPVPKFNSNHGLEM